MASLAVQEGTSISPWLIVFGMVLPWLLVALPERPVRGEMFAVSTRRGKQFNSMIQRSEDPLTGASREDVFMSEEDAARIGLLDGARVLLTSSCGEFHGRIRISPIKPGNLEVHWPEGMPLLSDAVDRQSGEPDYNALVRVAKD